MVWAWTVAGRRPIATAKAVDERIIRASPAKRNGRNLAGSVRNVRKSIACPLERNRFKVNRLTL
jgi:hypothetical protein